MFAFCYTYVVHFGLRCICMNIKQVTCFNKDFSITLCIVIVILFFIFPYSVITYYHTGEFCQPFIKTFS